jgi:hypothetical protein
MDISEFMDFDFYQFVKYRDAKFDRDEPVQLSRWLGIAHEIGTPMTYWILKGNVQIICRSTVRPEKEARTQFNNTITEKYGEYDPAMLEVFENEYIAHPSSLDEDLRDQRKRSRDYDLDGHIEGDLECHSPLDDVQVLAQSDMVRGPDLFHNAEIIYPLGESTKLPK